MHVFLLVGGMGSGKTEAAKMLQEMLNCPRFSLSDVVREHATLEGVEWSRENLIAMGESIREDTQLNEVFALQSLHQFWMHTVNADNAIALIEESNRHPAELDVLLQECAIKSIPASVLAIILDADPLVDRQLRGERVLAAGRPGDPTTLEEFYALNDREYYGHAESFGPYIEGCINYPGVIPVYNHLEPEFMRQQLQTIVMEKVGRELKYKLK